MRSIKLCLVYLLLSSYIMLIHGCIDNKRKVEKLYYKNGVLKEVIEYMDTVYISKSYYKSGVLKDEVKYLGKEYLWKTYYEGGGLYEVVESIKDCNRYKVMVYYESGVQKKKFYLIKDTIVDGVYSEYNEKGIKTEDRFYINGEIVLQNDYRYHNNELRTMKVFMPDSNAVFDLRGTLEYNQDGTINEKESFYYNVTGIDTIVSGDELKTYVKCFSYNYKIDRINLELYDMGNDLKFENDSNITKIKSFGNTLDFIGKPNKTGYNYFFGTLNVSFSDNRGAKFTNNLPFYKEFYVTDSIKN